MRYYLFALLFVTTLTPVLAQSTQQDLLYSADISSGEKRLYGDITLSGFFSPEKISDFGTVWKVEKGKLMELHFNLPVAIENCRLKIRDFGMPRNKDTKSVPLLIINGSHTQQLYAANLQTSQTRFYDFDQETLRVGDNMLKIAGIKHDLGIQSLEIHCKAPLPTAKMDEAANESAITLLAPIADQYIPKVQPLDIKWTTANLPEHARLDIDYLAKNGDWQTIDKGIPYNHPTNTGKRGFYRWEKLPTDVNPQLQVRLRYDTEQSAAGKIWIEKTTGIKFIYIPPGCFQIGSKENESGHQKDETQTRVCVEGFWMGKTEVTNKQYRFKENAHDSGEGFNHDEQPVVNVKRSQAKKFSQWLSQQKTGKQFRLPTEAEWEYAARAGQTTAYPWGDEPNEACQFANVKGKRLAHNCKDNHAITAPVAQFDTNAFQLHDMIGNVAEWTCSTLNKSYTKANTCGDFKGFAVIRGGSWKQFGDDIRFAKRTWALDSQQIGFRLVREAKSN